MSIKIGFIIVISLCFIHSVVFGYPYVHSTTDFIFHLYKNNVNPNFLPTDLLNYPSLSHIIMGIIPFWELQVLILFILSFMVIPYFMPDEGKVLYYLTTLPLKLVGLQAQLFIILCAIGFFKVKSPYRLIFLILMPFLHRTGIYLMLGGLIIWIFPSRYFTRYTQY